MDAMEWTWSRIFAGISGLFGVAFNSFLLPIIFYRSSKHIGSYKYLLLLYTLDAAAYSLTQLLTLPTFYVSEKGLMFYQQLPLLARIPGTIVIFCFVYFHAMIVLVLTLCFIYRYLVMTRPEKLTWFQVPRKALLIYSIPFIIAFYLVSTAVTALRPTSESDIVFVEPAYEATSRNISQMAYIGAAVILNGKTNPKMVICMWSFATMVLVCSTLIFSCIYGVVKSLKGSINMVKKAKSYNKKLFWLLLTQTLLPFMFTFTPPLVSWLLALFQINLGNVLGLFGDIMTFAQVLDPILVFYFISDYRRALLSFFLRRNYHASVTPSDRKHRSNISTTDRNLSTNDRNLV